MTSLRRRRLIFIVSNLDMRLVFLHQFFYHIIHGMYLLPGINRGGNILLGHPKRLFK